MVKQIMDHPRCAQLKEGDVILEVNGEKVSTYLHSDVVTVLKRCSKGNQASFTVLRMPLHQEVSEGGGNSASTLLKQAGSCIRVLLVLLHACLICESTPFWQCAFMYTCYGQALDLDDPRIN